MGQAPAPLSATIRLAATAVASSLSCAGAALANPPADGRAVQVQ
jgi:hypothetical protein